MRLFLLASDGGELAVSCSHQYQQEQQILESSLCLEGAEPVELFLTCGRQGVISLISAEYAFTDGQVCGVVCLVGN